MDQLAAADVATFWIGLPIMRSGNYSENIAHLNGLIGAEAQERGIPFVPLWEVAADDDGRYSDHLRDLSGRTRLMRANDGIHFTPRGYDLLAHHVLEAMGEELAIFHTGIGRGGTAVGDARDGLPPQPLPPAAPATTVAASGDSSRPRRWRWGCPASPPATAVPRPAPRPPSRSATRDRSIRCSSAWRNSKRARPKGRSS